MTTKRAGSKKTATYRGTKLNAIELGEGRFLVL
jgi:hypothetical protein